MSKVQFARVVRYSCFMHVVVWVSSFQFGVFHKQSHETMESGFQRCIV